MGLVQKVHRESHVGHTSNRLECKRLACMTLASQHMYGRYVVDGGVNSACHKSSCSIQCYWLLKILSMSGSFLENLVTRMHSSRMCTTHRSSHSRGVETPQVWACRTPWVWVWRPRGCGPGGLPEQTPSWEQKPPGADPPVDRQTCVKL